MPTALRQPTGCSPSKAVRRQAALAWSTPREGRDGSWKGTDKVLFRAENGRLSGTRFCPLTESESFKELKVQPVQGRGRQSLFLSAV